MVKELATTRAVATTTVRSGSTRAEVVVAESVIGLRIAQDGREATAELELGITVAGVDLGTGSELLRLRHREVADRWRAHSGKARGVREYRHAEAELQLRHASGLEWQLRVRVAEDGVAVRYGIDALEGVSRLDSDGTRLALPDDGRAWVLDYQTWYETPRRGTEIAELSVGDYGFPVLLRMGGLDEPTHLLLTESGIDGRFSGSHATVETSGGLRFTPADPATEIARGDVTPWRVVLIGTLDELVESSFVEELAPASELSDADWVRPGRAAWSWWSDFFSGAQLERQKHFVDRAAEFGWEHLLIDCGWEETWVPEIVAYASLRGVQVHLWAVWHDLDGPEKLRRLALWRSWGVAGIKVDFMESESKDRYRWYDSILAETARLGLMVNFHGSVIPRGWARSWPQVVSYEAIRGSEYYVFYQDTPLAAAHNVIQPFTRNVVGAMDYTPVAFTAPGRSTSDAHELALSVVFESGITHFADDVDAYAARPAAARFLSELPPAWDETVLLAGTPDTEAVIARRSGDRWFLGVIATGPERSLRVPLTRLGLGPATAWVVGDGPADLAARSLEVGEHLELDLVRDGGGVAILASAGAELFRAVPRSVAASPRVEPVLAELDALRSATLVTSDSALLRLPPGWRASRLEPGRWQITAPETLPPGALGVIAVEEAGQDGVPRVAHARLIAPLTPGEHPGSTLPLLAFRNESGPVERDQSNGGGNPRDGQRMRVAAEESDDGFGVSTPSQIDLHLGGRAELVVLAVGIDDETPGTRALARVLGDGRELARVELHAGTLAHELEVEVRGVRILSLATGAGEPAGAPAHVDWMRPRVHVPPHDLHTD